MLLPYTAAESGLRRRLRPLPDALRQTARVDLVALPASRAPPGQEHVVAAYSHRAGVGLVHAPTDNPRDRPPALRTRTPLVCRVPLADDDDFSHSLPFRSGIALGPVADGQDGTHELQRGHSHVRHRAVSSMYPVGVLRRVRTNSYS